MRRSVKIFWRVILILILFALAAGVVLSTVSGFFLQQKYLDPWENNYYTSFTDKRLKVAAHGLLAPNAHNMQLWKIKLDREDSSVFYLYADTDLHLKVDSSSNDLMICQGVFIEFCAVGAKQLGYEVGVQLFPDGQIDESDFIASAKSKPVAKLTVTHTGDEPDEEQTIIYDGIFRPHTNRSEYYRDRPVTAAQKQLITAAAMTGAPEQLSLNIYTDEASVSKIRELGVRGREIELHTERIVSEAGESFRPNEYIKNEKRFGSSAEMMGLSGIKMQLAQGLVTIFPSLNKGENATKRQIEDTSKALYSTPAFVAITSTEQSRAMMVETGRAYARMQLAASANGLSLQPLSQLVYPFEEAAEVRGQFLDEFTKNGAQPLMTTRLGVAQKPAVKSMRKSLDQIVVG